MDDIFLPKGADLLIKIPLYDNTNTIIDGTTFSKLVVSIKHANGTLIAKFSKNTASGYGPIYMVNAALGEISVKLLTTHTLASPEGKLFYEVHAQIPDVNYTDDSVLDLISTDNYLCTIIKSITGGVTLP